MRFPFRLGRREYMMERIDETHADALATLHQDAFSRPWSETEFAALIAQEAVSGFIAIEIGRAADPPAGFVLMRMAADEAEILTIAVAQAHRGRGIGWALMDAALRQMHADRMARVFLEVDEGNRAAIALYRRLGFTEVGRRPSYYAAEEAGSGNALIMRRDLWRAKGGGPRE
ncbi:ribosomal protein S18-alanine N-acetyltransferase [Chelativorans sp. ZYF759]|uniref:ribosomal protein S18-alanine N-acetyltransferase n=1 Tax=Chelativorans sp. ZYF759 TaxID=2692213 RepID=UPI00145FCC80|nr:ribosomal protein S18-alanine N-acetyltransferase [Chelativorans sp. ZYF759]NMG40416.1 ribosomal protein S18-alanine N-acetyltransferase [Chelativorans sp. ZYF759]